MVKVLLAEHDAALGRSVLQSLGKVAIAGEWVRSASELREWTARQSGSERSLVLLDWELPGAASGEPLDMLQCFLPAASIVVLSEQLSGDGAAVLLSQGIPSIHKPVNPFVLSMLALDLSSDTTPPPPQTRAVQPAALPLPMGPAPTFDHLVAAYAASRKLSKQQMLILDLYLSGKTDKEIAEQCACSGATVYEHWRRMARKSGGRQKSDLIADFHRYLRHAPGPGAALHGPASAGEPVALARALVG